MTAGNGGPAEVLQWFTDASARPSKVDDVDVAGATIAYETWGTPQPQGPPPILLIHGTGANRSWWTHVAGPLSDSRVVVAMDLSGHGDSSHRACYDLATWTSEVAAVIAAVDSVGRGAHIVGHSLGGDVAALAAQRADAPIAGIAMCETVRDPRAPNHPVVLPRPRPYFETKDEALARFRSVPTRASDALFIVDRLARHSIVHHHDGWTWKHDTSVASALQSIVPTLDELLPSIRCRMAIVRAEHGLVSEADVERLRAVVPGRLDVATIAGSGHHPMLDRPRELTEVIRLMTDRWWGEGPDRDVLRDG